MAARRPARERRREREGGAVTSREECWTVKKLLIAAGVLAGVAIAIRRGKASKADSELWRQATAPGSQ
jgi:hypothetical protein